MHGRHRSKKSRITESILAWVIGMAVAGVIAAFALALGLAMYLAL